MEAIDQPTDIHALFNFPRHWLAYVAEHYRVSITDLEFIKLSSSSSEHGISKLKNKDDEK